MVGSISFLIKAMLGYADCFVRRFIKADFGIAVKPADSRNNPEMAHTQQGAVFRLQG